MNGALLVALGAGLCNGTAGIFSKNLMAQGFRPETLIFYKCFISALVLGMFALRINGKRAMIELIRSHGKRFLFASFFGFFVLYSFETKAYALKNVGSVAFLLLCSATLTTYALQAFWEKKLPNRVQMAALVLALLGLGLIFGAEGLELKELRGSALALIAGVGYGTFLCLCPRWSIKGSLIHLWALLSGAAFWLLLPALPHLAGDPSPFHAPLNFIGIILIPTIGGFWCTTYALTKLSSHMVQIVELTEPLFACLFAYMFLSESVGLSALLGALCIIGAIALMHQNTPQENAKVAEH